MRFKVGDKAVYPSHGVTIIKGVESKEVGGDRLDFYVLQIVSSGATLMVPIQASERAGMRDLIDGPTITNVYSILRQPGKISQKTWNRRFREFNEKLRTGSIADVSEVYRDLWSLQAQKELSYGEKQMLEKSRQLIVSEISAATGDTEEQVEAEILQIMQPH